MQSRILAISLLSLLPQPCQGPHHFSTGLVRECLNVLPGLRYLRHCHSPVPHQWPLEITDFIIIQKSLERLPFMYWPKFISPFSMTWKAFNSLYSAQSSPHPQLCFFPLKSLLSRELVIPHTCQALSPVLLLILFSLPNISFFPSDAICIF